MSWDTWAIVISLHSEVSLVCTPLYGMSKEAGISGLIASTPYITPYEPLSFETAI